MKELLFSSLEEAADGGLYYSEGTTMKVVV
jgi:hypothetical protein